MSYETVAIIWFGLWGLIWTVYFILDGYTLGTGILFPFLAKNRQERNQLQEAVGPFWGGNEVWLITAGGATFAAFPAVYADLFSFLYTPMMLILFALFFRAAGLEFMHKGDAPLWQKSWKWAFTISSFALALLFGVAFANLFYGLKIGPSGYEGTFFSLLHPYGLLGGLLFISLFIVSGALWVTIKTVGDVAQRAYQIARPASVVAAVVLSLFFVATSNRTTLFDNFTKAPILWIVPALTFVCALLMLLFVWQKRIGLAFANICLTIFTLMATGFIGMFPNMLPSRINDEYSTTLFEAAGSELNLKIMLGVAIVMVPIIISYQLWSYKLFKEKITKETAKGYQ